MTEGNFFSKHDGFPEISTMLSEDKVDERGKTIRVHSASASIGGENIDIDIDAPHVD